MPEDEAEDHFEDDVEEPMELCPGDLVEQLHEPQGGAEVEVQILKPDPKIVPTYGPLRLADGSRPKRLTGKQHVDRLPPGVSKLLWTTTGGSGLDAVAWPTSSSSSTTSSPASASAEPESREKMQQDPQHKLQKQLQQVQGLCLLRHQELNRLRREELQIGGYDMLGETLEEIDGEIGRLECALRGLAKLEPEAPEPETLVTRTLTLDEMRNDLDAWKEPIRAEYQSLLNHGAIEPISREAVKKLQETHEVEIILGGCDQATFQKEARPVACGNQAYKNEHAEVAAGGLCAISVRSLISRASQKSWCCATVDVKTAFLQAPRREEVKKLTCMSPPSIEREICGDSLWRVRGALYGLLSRLMIGMSTEMDASKPSPGRAPTVNNIELFPRLNHMFGKSRQCKMDHPLQWGTSASMWTICSWWEMIPLSTNEALEALGKTSTLAAPEFVTSDKTVTFCGYEIRQTAAVFELGKSKYITELLDKHGIQEEGWVPCYVRTIAIQTLKYLRRTTETIKFDFCAGEAKLGTLVGASFGPPHEGYCSVLGCKLNRQWSGDLKSSISQLTGDTGVWRTRHLRLRSAKLRKVIQDPTEPWSVDHVSGLDLGAYGLTKPLQGQAFNRFLELINFINMSDVGEAHAAKAHAEHAGHHHAVVNFNTMLTGLGAAVMGTGALTDYKALVVCGFALVAASLCRQRAHKVMIGMGRMGKHFEVWLSNLMKLRYQISWGLHFILDKIIYQNFLLRSPDLSLGESLAFEPRIGRALASAMELERAMGSPCPHSKLSEVVIKPTHGGVVQVMVMEMEEHMVIKMLLMELIDMGLGEVKDQFNQRVLRGDFWKAKPENGGELLWQQRGGLLGWMGRWMIQLKMCKLMKEHQWHLSQGRHRQRLPAGHPFQHGNHNIPRTR
eukprot:s1047_g10.t1